MYIMHISIYLGSRLADVRRKGAQTARVTSAPRCLRNLRWIFGRTLRDRDLRWRAQSSKP